MAVLKRLMANTTRLKFGLLILVTDLALCSVAYAAPSAAVVSVQGGLAKVQDYDPGFSAGVGLTIASFQYLQLQAEAGYVKATQEINSMKGTFQNVSVGVYSRYLFDPGSVAPFVGAGLNVNSESSKSAGASTVEGHSTLFGATVGTGVLIRQSDWLAYFAEARYQKLGGKLSVASFALGINL